MFDLVVVAVSLVALAVENVPGLRRDIQKQFLRNLFPIFGRDISRDLTFFLTMAVQISARALHSCRYLRPMLALLAILAHLRQILPLDGADPEQRTPRLSLFCSTLRLMRAFRVLRLFGRLSSLRQIINALTAAIVNPKTQTPVHKP